MLKQSIGMTESDARLPRIGSLPLMQKYEL